MSRVRTLDEIMKRGRWRSFRSLTRYERHASVSLEFNKLDRRIRDHCVTCEAQLEAVFLGRARPLLPPVLRA